MFVYTQSLVSCVYICVDVCDGKGCVRYVCGFGCEGTGGVPSTRVMLCVVLKVEGANTPSISMCIDIVHEHNPYFHVNRYCPCPYLCLLSIPVSMSIVHMCPYL